MKKLQGIPAVNGIAIGKVLKLEQQFVQYEQREVSNVNEEVARLQTAITKTISDLETVKKETEEKLTKAEAAVFTAHIMLLQDDAFVEPIIDNIKTKSMMAEDALQLVSDDFCNELNTQGNVYMRERIIDIQDITKQVLHYLVHEEKTDVLLLDEAVIIIAKDILPSQATQFNRNLVKGMVTDSGGTTSHTAIIARAFDIPTVVGANDISEQTKTGDIVILDGFAGTVIIHPDELTLKEYQLKQEEIVKQRGEIHQFKNANTVSADGETLQLVANIGLPEETNIVLDHGGEGIGLYRSEYLFMGRNTIPTEDEQYEAYRMILNNMHDKEVIIRTLDIGADKNITYLNFPTELNPMLGLRGIRYSLQEETIFRTQLRALLRASVHGHLKIMFPMVATLAEFQAAKTIFTEEKARLEQEHIPVASSVDLGIMVELPATAMLAAQFAETVDFFSIGTNDLIQYTFGADRLNEQLTYLQQPLHPAILHLIDRVITAANEAGKPVALCGEMANDEQAIPVLLALGLRTFSISSPAILPTRVFIKQLDVAKLITYKQQLLSMNSAEEVMQFMKENRASYIRPTQ